MNKPMRKTHPILKITNNSFVDLSAPINISTWWNFGSLLGLCLIIQILTGLFLAMYYTADINLALNSINHMCRDANNGWFMRTLHANGASFFFICIYLHIGRGISNGNSCYMVFTSMSTNFFLSSYRNYKFIICYPLYWN